MNYNIKEENGYHYIDEGKGEILLMLHGLFGALSNWEGVISHFKSNYRIIIPLMPIHDMPIKEAGCEGLTVFIEDFVSFKQLDKFSLIGNSLGGHVALIYTLRHPEKVQRLILTGSSGLFENTMGGSYPKRGNYEYIKERVEYTFYDPKTASKELVDEVFEITNSIPKVMRIIAIAKSAQRNNMAKDIVRINTPTLLIWGLNDTITPPQVGHEFNQLIQGSELQFIDQCCHAPMMERPNEFNAILDKWLQKTKV
ncbi:alpha/beta fold hydrolase [Aquirufa ecclesiirivi]|uniref:alpha/beta fold hydrolase n=1 Tax=Aquirufa ecclesiirivi TaxID=2715124 RepID=UPI00140A043B|nr:alpha/beta hydrolase [Aquirufa ecclesiirivi]MCZ2472654.1 alpha/beta hydrolase [Aquirufa ecclesiirivi]NHC49782.1 alpha/beta hydrolase [Aquirufa ecclesiirivi]